MLNPEHGLKSATPETLARVLLQPLRRRPAVDRVRADGSGALAGAFVLVLLAAPPVLAEPPFRGTVWVSSEIITSEDPSGLTGVSYTGRGDRTIWDYRVFDWIVVNAYLFEARIKGRSVEFQVNPEFDSVDAARAEVDTYALALGRMPAVLLSRVEKVHVNAGNPEHPDAERFGRLDRRGNPGGQPATRVFGGNYYDRSITVHTGYGQQTLRRGFIEEVFFHEGAHVSLQNHQDAPGWRAAQEADGEFISDYARDHPDGEDVAESVLLYFALRHRPARLSDRDRAAIEETIPNRLTYFDALSLDWSPYAAAVAPFTDDPLRPGVTPIRAVHFTELRTRIGALRAAVGLAPFDWTDAVLQAGVTPIRIVHLLELREALGTAYEAAGRVVPRWTDAAPVAGSTVIRAAHLTELRALVISLE